MKCMCTSKFDLIHAVVWAIAMITLAIFMAGHDYAEKVFLLAVLAFVTTQTVLSRRNCKAKNQTINQGGHSE